MFRIQCCTVIWHFFVTRTFVLNSCCWIISVNVKLLSGIFLVWGPGLLHVHGVQAAHQSYEMLSPSLSVNSLKSPCRGIERSYHPFCFWKKVGFILWNLRWLSSYLTPTSLAVLLPSPVTSFYNFSSILVAVCTVTESVAYGYLIYDCLETSANGYITCHLVTLLSFIFVTLLWSTTLYKPLPLYTSDYDWISILFFTYKSNMNFGIDFKPLVGHRYNSDGQGNLRHNKWEI